MPRNPNWTRDEIVLALDIYMGQGRQQLAPTHPKIVELSKLLNELPLYPQEQKGSGYRNPTSVSLKLGNLISVDPQHQGTGLPHGGKLERKLWEEFASDPHHLHQVAKAIRHSYQSVKQSELQEAVVDEEFQEGRILTTVHRKRERNSRIVRQKKEQVLAQTGQLTCEICNFDFSSFYGPLGHGFIECHHLRPLSELQEGQKTQLSDLALVCSNCHRMLHRSRPLLTPDELRVLI